MNRVGLGGRAVLAILGVFCLPLVAGCGCGGPREVSVSGVVMRQGLPVPNLLVLFGSGDERAYWGLSNAEGRFQLQGREGRATIPRGVYKVWVNYEPVPDDPVSLLTGDTGTAAKPPPGLKQILTKYGKRDTSPLQFEITKPEDDLLIELN